MSESPERSSCSSNGLDKDRTTQEELAVWIHSLRLGLGANLEVVRLCEKNELGLGVGRTDSLLHLLSALSEASNGREKPVGYVSQSEINGGALFDEYTTLCRERQAGQIPLFTAPPSNGRGIPAGWRDIIEGLIDVIERADTAEGHCCCGDKMDAHSSPLSCGHSPVDAGEYHAAGWVDQARALLAAAPQPPVQASAEAEDAK